MASIESRPTPQPNAYELARAAELFEYALRRIEYMLAKMQQTPGADIRTVIGPELLMTITGGINSSDGIEQYSESEMALTQAQQDSAMRINQALFDDLIEHYGAELTTPEEERREAYLRRTNVALSPKHDIGIVGTYTVDASKPIAHDYSLDVYNLHNGQVWPRPTN